MTTFLSGPVIYGIVKLNVEPFPTSLSTQIFPPSISTYALVIERPKPASLESSFIGNICLDKTMKNSFLPVFWNPNTRVFHEKMKKLVLQMISNFDSALIAVFDGIF